MNLKQLEYFVQVAELGSFSKAASVLDVAQPALIASGAGAGIRAEAATVRRATAAASS